VSGDNADNALLRVTDEGYVLESDNLKDGVSVSVSDRDKTANLNLYTSYNKILIHEVNDTTIGIKIDTDGDGKFETEYSPSYLGDVNQDGMISVADAVVLQKYLLSKSDVSKIQYIASDLNMDGSVDAFDMVSLRKKLINK
ncbi:MAG: dockerin type I repeat-containing protein, partial [Ruminococcus sp.]|nr:dockerin type I repeat-containing protein [Ruminococcus sp.]